MIGIAVDICKNFIDFFVKNKQITEEKKLKISKILEDISLILVDTADKFDRGEYPHGNCVVMQNLSSSLCKKLEGMVEQQDLKKLEKSLMDASFLEKLYAKRNEETIKALQIASGEFKSLSIIIKL